jgi:ribose transport system ATP-binding protein
VLRGLDLTVEPGSFVGLIGANGAGKSTLIKILDGVTAPSAGQIRLGTETVSSLGDRAEVAFVHQDLGLVDGISIADNFRLGEAPMRRFGIFLDLSRERREAEAALARVEVDRSPDTLVGELSPAEKTLVAIARAFARGATILVMDEATSNLTTRGARRVLDVLAGVVAAGGSVIMVTHRLAEIIDATTRVVALVDGQIVHDAPTSELDREAVARMLVSHAPAALDSVVTSPGDVMVRLTGVTYPGIGPGIGPFDLEVRAGEVVGLTGNQGSGLHEIGFLVHGSHVPSAGSVWRADGLKSALVPPHRETQGGFADLTVMDNTSIASLRSLRSGVRLLNLQRELAGTMRLIGRLQVKPAAPDAIYSSLSGGNKQKVLFARALLTGARLFILCEPTRGVDPSTRNEIYHLIREVRATGAAVLVVSSDSEDLVAVADRVGLVSGGRIGLMTDMADLSDDGLEAYV